jgi:hypothetical protein
MQFLKKGELCLPYSLVFKHVKHTTVALLNMITDSVINPLLNIYVF